MLFLFSASVFSQDCASGSFYDQERLGEGIDMTITEKATYGYFYTFALMQPEWFTFLAPAGSTTATLYQTKQYGFDPFLARTFVVGTMEIDTIDEDHITFTMDLTLDVRRLDNPDVVIPWCLSGCERTMVYERLTSICQ
jgi:hypothetical protein